MNDDTTGKNSKAEAGTDWDRLRVMTDDEVHAAILADPDVRPTDEEFWKRARVVKPQHKKSVTKVDSEGFYSDMRFRRAVKRIYVEAIWLSRYQVAIKSLHAVQSIGTDFFRVALTALEDARLIRLIRILEDNGRVASIWYLYRCNQRLIEAAASQTGLDINELKNLADKLRAIRDKAFVHIDKERVFNPQKLYREADLKIDKLECVATQLRKTMEKVYCMMYQEELEYDNYEGSDILLLAQLRDEAEEGGRMG